MKNLKDKHRADFQRWTAEVLRATSILTTKKGVQIFLLPEQRLEILTAATEVVRTSLIGREGSGCR